MLNPRGAPLRSTGRCYVGCAADLLVPRHSSCRFLLRLNGGCATAQRPPRARTLAEPTDPLASGDTSTARSPCEPCGPLRPRWIRRRHDAEHEPYGVPPIALGAPSRTPRPNPKPLNVEAAVTGDGIGSAHVTAANEAGNQALIDTPEAATQHPPSAAQPVKHQVGQVPAGLRSDLSS